MSSGMLWEQKTAGWTKGDTEFRALQEMSTKIRVFMGVRLSAERERLALTQTAFAELGGAKARTLQDWERGLAAPSSEFLVAVAAHGVDLLYVLTGRRIPATAGELSADEAELLDHYRASDAEGKVAARKVLSALARLNAK